MNKYKFEQLVRITKKQAEKLYNTGMDLVICPVKINPLNSHFICTLNKPGCGSMEFDRVCNYLKYYNCNNEVGNYLAYYFNEA